jgi:hypothetical protein
MTTPEITPPAKRFSKWQIALLAFIVLVFVWQMLDSSSETSSSSTSSTSSSSSSSTANYDTSWIPSDFSGFQSDNNIAWRWATSKETNCTYSSGSCWAAMVITRDGCPSGIYAEIAILDKSGVQIDFTNDSTTRVLPKTKVKLTFDTFNEQAEKAQISEIRCS